MVLHEEVSRPHAKKQGDEDAICFSKFSLPKWKLFKACLSREFLLMKRNSFVYVFKLSQVISGAVVNLLFPFLTSYFHTA